MNFLVRILPVVSVVSILINLASASIAQDQQVESKAPAEVVKAWQDLRFGMFIHWGPVSLRGTEIGWSRAAQVKQEEYDNLYKEFNPALFDANEWAKAAKAAGMTYMVLVTKHHDGFCLWNTKETDYNIMNSPFERDVTKELAKACRKQGIKFGTYYSACDWYNQYFPNGSPGGSTKKPTADIAKYAQYLEAQVTELVKNYGPLCTIWFDVPQSYTAEYGISMVNNIRKLQPDITINNRAYTAAGKGQGPFPNTVGDYDTPEQHIGGFNRERPWETCMTICNQWAWKPNDGMKSLKQCVQSLILTASGDGNFLFNVGPMPDGRIEQRQIDRLAEMGQWLDKYGESIYGTRGGPFKPGKSVASTCKGSKIYVHILDKNRNELVLPAIGPKVKSAKLLTGGDVKAEQTAEGISLKIDAKDMQDIDTLVAIEIDGDAFGIPPADVKAGSAGASGVKASASNVFQNSADYGADKACDGDPDTRWATDGGTKQCSLDIELKGEQEISKASIVMDDEYAGRIQKYELQVMKDGSWQTVSSGTTLKAKDEIKFTAVKTAKVRLNILDATDGPTVNELSVK